MNGDSYQVVRAEGGFIVYVNKQADQPPEKGTLGGDHTSRVFIDSSTLINFLRNELAGSN